MRSKKKTVLKPVYTWILTSNQFRVSGVSRFRVAKVFVKWMDDFRIHHNVRNVHTRPHKRSCSWTEWKQVPTDTPLRQLESVLRRVECIITKSGMGSWTSTYGSDGQVCTNVCPQWCVKTIYSAVMYISNKHQFLSAFIPFESSVV